MIKKLFLLCVFFVISCVLFAADVADFVDMGFSSNGEFYLFGQHGNVVKKAGSSNGYAEFCVVDIKENEFVEGSPFKNGPSYKTAGKSGQKVFDELVTSEDAFIEKYAIPAESNSVVLYIAPDKDKKKQIEFRDFESSTDDNVIKYSVRLTELVEGSGENAVSCFYLWVEQQNNEGDVLKRILVGNPQKKRDGVVGYELCRVLRDVSGKNFVFVIQKKVADSTGVNIRYMVETVNIS